MLERVNTIADTEAQALIDDAVTHPILIKIRLGGARVGDTKPGKSIHTDGIEIFPDPGADPRGEDGTQDNDA
ncbi:MAG: hypothetical protein C0511_20335 [Hyphomicrobium sp.]|nr:hypothetical protein [Hyphomicrobium sp.]